MEQEKYRQYITILEEELQPAMGCTEPITVAYAAACAKKILGQVPERVEVDVCGNILKNVKSVVVPNTGRMRGICAAVAAGVVAGDAEKKLLVIADVSQEQLVQIRKFTEQIPCRVQPLNSGRQLDVIVRLYCGDTYSAVRVANGHTNIIEIVRNGQILLQSQGNGEQTEKTRRQMTLTEILEFAETVPLTCIQPLVQRQICCNEAIAEEGLRGAYGSGVGKLTLESESGIAAEAIAYAAAGSDARMSGCELPVVIIAGSGNQGMTTSLPVIRYAKHTGASKEELYRALLVSDLVTIYQKEGIGKLSAFCGAVSAGCGAAAGIAYLETKNASIVEQTINNTLAMAPGIVCDGAKASCAAKISLSVRAGLIGYALARAGRSIPEHDGLLGGSADETIAHIGMVAREGMAGTDNVIIHIMCGC